MTSAAHLLFRAGERDTSPWKGSAFPVAGRTVWTVDLIVHRLAASGSVTVQVDSSPTGADEDSFSELHDFGAVSATGKTTEHLTLSDPVPKYLRGHVTANTGRHTIELVARAPFLDLADAGHLDLLSQELRRWEDGLTRTVEDAERDVLGLLRPPRDSRGVLRGNPTAEGYAEWVRQLVAVQADYLFSVDRVARSKEKGASARLRQAPRLAPGLEARARTIAGDSSMYWRHR